VGKDLQVISDLCACALRQPREDLRLPWRTWTSFYGRSSFHIQMNRNYSQCEYHIAKCFLRFNFLRRLSARVRRGSDPLGDAGAQILRHYYRCGAAKVRDNSFALPSPHILDENNQFPLDCHSLLVAETPAVQEHRFSTLQSFKSKNKHYLAQYPHMLSALLCLHRISSTCRT
jgi:hypothetical protein